MKEPSIPFRGISGSTLKLIAIITMLIDHTGATVILAITRHPAIIADPARLALWRQVYSISRDIGRLAFPIFCFLLVEGFLHTHDIRKYAQRLFLFALVSEIPFDIALKTGWYDPGKQNVYFTLRGSLPDAAQSPLSMPRRSRSDLLGASCAARLYPCVPVQRKTWAKAEIYILLVLPGAFDAALCAQDIRDPGAAAVIPTYLRIETAMTKGRAKPITNSP